MKHRQNRRQRTSCIRDHWRRARRFDGDVRAPAARAHGDASGVKANPYRLWPPDVPILARVLDGVLVKDMQHLAGTGSALGPGDEEQQQGTSHNRDARAVEGDVVTSGGVVNCAWASGERMFILK